MRKGKVMLPIYRNPVYFSILGALHGYRGGLRCQAIADRLGRNQSVIYRQLKVLVQISAIDRDKFKYRLNSRGQTLLDLGTRYFRAERDFNDLKRQLELLAVFNQTKKGQAVLWDEVNKRYVDVSTKVRK